MKAAIKNITVECGATFNWRGFLQNSVDSSAFDLADYTARAQIRASAASRVVIANMVCTIPSPESSGELRISIAKSVTATLKPGVYHWDCFIDSDTAGSQKLMKGKVTIEAANSR